MKAIISDEASFNQVVNSKNPYKISTITLTNIQSFNREIATDTLRFIAESDFEQPLTLILDSLSEKSQVAEKLSWLLPEDPDLWNNLTCEKIKTLRLTNLTEEFIEQLALFLGTTRCTTIHVNCTEAATSAVQKILANRVGTKPQVIDVNNYQYRQENNSTTVFFKAKSSTISQFQLDNGVALSTTFSQIFTFSLQR